MERKLFLSSLHRTVGFDTTDAWLYLLHLHSLDGLAEWDFRLLNADVKYHKSMCDRYCLIEQFIDLTSNERGYSFTDNYIETVILKDSKKTQP